ncbi:Uncharacterized protein FKW44_005917, partial [Caligus rogercresseyi]
DPKYLRAVLLFGLSVRNKASPPKSKAIEFALLNAKALIAKKLTVDEPIRPGEIRGILLAAAARYAAFSLKIPSSCGSTWTFAADSIKYYPFKSHCLEKLLKSL